MTVAGASAQPPHGGASSSAGVARPAAPTPAEGAPDEGLDALASALVTAAKTAPTDTSDPHVSIAFALGWQMAELFRPKQRRGGGTADDDLPGLGSLGDSERTQILIKQVQAQLTMLKEPIEKSGLPLVDVSGLTGLVGKEGELKAKILVIHGELLATLTAADYRLGKAYGLGRALADTCRKPTDEASLKEELAVHRVANLLGWLDDLSCALPPHAAHSVGASLKRWVKWAGVPPQGQTAEEALHALRRQGDLWRGLLSGEKQGSGMLEIDNYLDAARELADQMRTILRGVVRRFPVLTGAIVFLILLGAGLFAAGGTSGIVAGAGSIIAALGLTWKGLGGALGQLAGKLEQPLWGAVLDRAIADAITLLPDSKADLHGRRDLALQAAAQPRAGDEEAPPAPAPVAQPPANMG
jgi:hypothetical protein